jgi:HK97 gp10 family phage protein
MEGIAKENSPVDTGNLRGKIYGETGENNGDIIARVGTNVEYAPCQEFGTYKMDPQPFLRPARDEMQNKAESIVKKHMGGVGK